MDSAVAKFAGVDECRYFRDTDFPKYHFRQGESNPMLHFFGEWSKDERASTKMTSLSMVIVSNYVSAYFTKWNAYIIEYVSTIGNQISLSDLTIQHFASFYGHRGGEGNLGKEKTAEHRTNISMALSGKVKVITDRQVQVDEWIDNLARANREIPLAFEDYICPVQVDKWIDNLARAKTFIDTKGRMPTSKAGDVDERSLGKWIAKFKHKERGTNSEREQLMRR